MEIFTEGMLMSIKEKKTNSKVFVLVNASVTDWQFDCPLEGRNEGMREIIDGWMNGKKKYIRNLVNYS